MPLKLVPAAKNCKDLTIAAACIHSPFSLCCPGLVIHKHQEEITLIFILQVCNHFTHVILHVLHPPHSEIHSFMCKVHVSGHLLLLCDLNPYTALCIHMQYNVHNACFGTQAPLDQSKDAKLHQYISFHL